MNFLRSKLFLVLAALVMLGVYSENVFHFCEVAGLEQHHRAQGVVDHGEGHDHGSGQGEVRCHCACHHTVTIEVAARVIEPTRVVAMATWMEAEVFPPDAVPLGIDHPPQLA